MYSELEPFNTKNDVKCELSMQYVFISLVLRAQHLEI